MEHQQLLDNPQPAGKSSSKPTLPIGSSVDNLLSKEQHQPLSPRPNMATSTSTHPVARNRDTPDVGGAEPQTPRPQPHQDTGATLRRNAKHIKLKIGDDIYETTVGTLVSHGGTFQAMFEGLSAEMISEAYFIDRKFKHFGIILEYLRTNVVEIPKTFTFVQVLELMAELNYFNIKADLYPHNISGYGDGIYQGPRNERGEPEGVGRFWATNDKCKYEGGFAAGKFNGKGKLIMNAAASESYEGSWKEGKRNGKGKQSSNSETITGEWKLEQIQNIDNFVGKDGRKVIPKANSTFSRAPPNDCTIDWPNGDSYEGKYDLTSKSFNRQGRGTIIYAGKSLLPASHIHTHTQKHITPTHNLNLRLSHNP
eukprot:TRINITY_DN2722_c0_g1_i1.p1 TRINITY_DN2722_c0_g1~~TRINITY_DN2722_c0_g1_i1.p1  ORF type:complete len:367 (-),score=61.50 TRINITY_DN2722_c0_g1_i1:288-1388(-)